MNDQRKVIVALLCKENVVCSIDEDRAISVPRNHFDFQPVVGQSVILDGDKGYLDRGFVDQLKFFRDP